MILLGYLIKTILFIVILVCVYRLYLNTLENENNSEMFMAAFTLEISDRLLNFSSKYLKIKKQSTQIIVIICTSVILMGFVNSVFK